MKPDGPVGVRPRPFNVGVVSDFVRKNGYYISNSEVEELFKKADQITSEDMLPLLKILPGVEELLVKLKKQIRKNASPRHVPDKVVVVNDIPRTKNGKIVELAVKNIIEGNEIKNIEALANPEVLNQYKNLKELNY